MRDNTDRRTFPLSLGQPARPNRLRGSGAAFLPSVSPTQARDPWFPFVVARGPHTVGVYWARDAKMACDFARGESRSFGPVDLTGKRLTATLHAAAKLPGVEVARA